MPNCPLILFRNLIWRIPNPWQTFEVTRKALETSEKRGFFSEHRQALVRRLEELLKVAPITQHFRDYIWGTFNTQYTFGAIVDESKYPEGSRDVYKVNWLLDRDDPEGGGIFDRVRAKEIERVGFRRALRQHLEIKLDQSPESLLEPDSSDQAYEEWRQEFIEKHCEEP